MALAILAGTVVRAAEPAVVPPDDSKLLALDTRLFVQTRNARLVPGKVVKDPRNPLFQADKPWENSMNNLYPNVLWDEEEKCFKLWYKCVLADKEAINGMDKPSTVHDVGWYLLYATSKDGLTWDKPKLGLHAYMGDAGTNIVARDTPNVGVFKDAHDPDASRRYKMVYDVGLGLLRARFSPDGIHWSEPAEMSGFGPRNGDTHNNAFWDERLKKYVWITKLYLGERLVARFESEDFLHWKNSGMVLRSSIDEGLDSQTYCMPTFRYGSVYLGYVMMYHLKNGRAVDCELAWSPDGIQWSRVFPGTPLIPRGEKGAYDSECIYAMAGPAVAQDGQLLIYYGGDDFPHTGWKRHCLPCLARLPLDHFAGYEAVDKNAPATLTTSQLKMQNAPLRLTMDARGGSLKITALDEGGRILARAEYADAELKDGAVKWEGDAGKALQGKTVRLDFELRSAQLFALGGATLVNPALPARSAAGGLGSPSALTTRKVSFDDGPAGWKGIDTLVHKPEGGKAGGYVTLSGQGRLLPIAASPAGTTDSPLAGDWARVLGGSGAEISCHIRSAKTGGKVRIEVFAGDVCAWAYETKTEFGPEWKRAAAKLKYDWTDDEAKAAGWQPAANAFS
ncbi:MAG: hypothetical protein ACAH88_17195, partial [Roseimicrobium sp.]